MAGAPIAIGDRVDTIGDNAHFFQNPEVLALRKAGLVGKPVFNNSHGFEFDPSSRDPERWIGQLPDGSWAVALFNRDDGPGTEPSRSTSPTSSASPVRPRCATSGPTRTWGR